MVSGVNFLTGVLFARYLGLEEFGRFTLAWMAVLFINSLQYAVIISPMMSIGPKQDETRRSDYYGAVILQQLFFAGGSCVLLAAGVRASQFLFPEWRVQPLGWPLASALATFQLQDFLRRYFFAQDRAGLAFLNDCVSYVGQLLLLIILFRASLLDAGKVLWLIAGTSGAAVVLGICFLGPCRISGQALHQVSGQHWHFAKWILASAVLQWTSGNFFLVAAGKMLGPALVGAIRAAQNIVGVIQILFLATENVVPGQAAKAYAIKGIEGLLGYLHRFAWWGGLITVSIALIAGVFADFWLALLYGNAYAGHAFIVRWFSIIYVIAFFVSPLTAGLRALEQTRVFFTSCLWTGIFSVVMAYPLIFFFGISGVMIGLLTVKAGVLALVAIDFRERLRTCG